MLKIAFRDYKKVIISDVEFNLKEPNYTINTLNYLTDKFPENIFSIIMGSDNFLKIKNWKSSGKIIEEHSIYVYPREGFDVTNIMNYKNITYLNYQKIKISSTLIRESIIYKAQFLDKYLPSAISEYIKTHQLYGYLAR
jgi:nicotinate-nucleotide adenylyltransferase